MAAQFGQHESAWSDQDVEAAQRRWYERVRPVSVELSRFERAQQDIRRLLRPLSEKDRKHLLVWAADMFLEPLPDEARAP